MGRLGKAAEGIPGLRGLSQPRAGDDLATERCRRVAVSCIRRLEGPEAVRTRRSARRRELPVGPGEPVGTENCTVSRLLNRRWWLAAPYCAPRGEHGRVFSRARAWGMWPWERLGVRGEGGGGRRGGSRGWMPRATWGRKECSLPGSLVPGFPTGDAVRTRALTRMPSARHYPGRLVFTYGGNVGLRVRGGGTDLGAGGVGGRGGGRWRARQVVGRWEAARRGMRRRKRVRTGGKAFLAVSHPCVLRRRDTSRGW